MAEQDDNRKRRKRARWRCLDCGVDVTKSGDYCMVHDAVWAATGLGPNDGTLCLDHMAARLGRQLRLEDFTACLPSLARFRAAIARGVVEAPRSGSPAVGDLKSAPQSIFLD